MILIWILVLIIIIVTIFNSVIIENYSEIIWNIERAIPVKNLTMAEHIYLNEMPDSWFQDKLDLLKNENFNYNSLIGMPISIESKDFRIKMGNIIGKYLITYLNGFVTETISDGRKINWKIQSYDILEVLYYYFDTPFHEKSINFYANISPNIKKSDNFCKIKSEYVIYRDSKAWGILLYLETLHFEMSQPQIIKFEIRGKIFGDKLNNLTTNTNDYKFLYRNI